MKKITTLLICTILYLISFAQPHRQGLVQNTEDEYQLRVFLCSEEDVMLFEEGALTLVETGISLAPEKGEEEDGCKSFLLSCSSIELCDHIQFVFEGKRIKVLSGPRGEYFARLLDGVTMQIDLSNRPPVIRIMDSTRSRVLSTRKLVPVGNKMLTSTASKRGKVNQQQISAYIQKPGLKQKESLIRSLTDRMTISVMTSKRMK